MFRSIACPVLRAFGASNDKYGFSIRLMAAAHAFHLFMRNWKGVRNKRQSSNLCFAILPKSNLDQKDPEQSFGIFVQESTLFQADDPNASAGSPVPSKVTLFNASSFIFRTFSTFLKTTLPLIFATRKSKRTPLHTQGHAVVHPRVTHASE